MWLISMLNRSLNLLQPKKNNDDMALGIGFLTSQQDNLVFSIDLYVCNYDHPVAFDDDKWWSNFEDNNFIDQMTCGCGEFSVTWSGELISTIKVNNDDTWSKRYRKSRHLEDSCSDWSVKSWMYTTRKLEVHLIMCVVSYSD